MDSELIAVEQTTAPHSLTLLKSKEEVQMENSQALAVLKEILDNKSDIVIIRGERHLGLEDWIAIGTAYGLSLKTGDAEPVEVFEAKGFKAKAEIIDRNTGLVIGGAEAYCLDNERNWEKKDYFQMASMAQTRAGSKAYANELKGVVALYKSLSGTPAEEMYIPDEENGNHVSQKHTPTKKAPTKAPVKKAPKTKEPIETNAEVVEGELVTEETEQPKKSTTIKELMDNNKHIQKAVHALQDQEIPVTRASISEKLMDLWDMGKIEKADYDLAIEELKQ